MSNTLSSRSPPAFDLCQHQFSSVQSLSSVRLSATPWIAARQASLLNHQLPEFTQTHVHQVSDAIQPSHPLSSPSPPAPDPSQHESFPKSQLFAWSGQSTGVSALASFLPKNTQDLSRPWKSPGQNTEVGSLSLLWGIFQSQGLNPGLLHCRQILYQLSHKGSPRILEWVAYPFSSGSSLSRNWTRVSCIAGRFFTKWAKKTFYKVPMQQSHSWGFIPRK